MENVTLIPRAFKAIFRNLVLLSGFFASSAYAQSSGNVPCPPNLDFEQGNYGGWTYSVGFANQGTAGNGTVFGNTSTSGANAGIPIGIPSTNPNTPPWASGTAIPTGPAYSNNQKLWSRFDTTSALVSPNDTDYYGGFKINPAGGGSYALQVGDDTAIYAAERIRYYVHVPAGFNDYSFNFRYAVVLQDPGTSHTPDEKPVFRIQAFDSATGANLPCAQQNYYGDGTVLAGYGFKTSPRESDVYYLPWTGGALPVIGQGGKTITIQVEALGCSQSGHWGYGYFDVISCGKYKAAVTYCNLDSNKIRFVGTGITQAYKWYTSNWTYLGTGAFIDAAIPNTPDFFYGVLANGTPGCLDTIVTDTVANFLLSTTPKTPCVQFGNPIPLKTTVIGGLPGAYTFQWNANSELSCTTCDNPTASPVDTTRYFVTVTDRVGCFRRDTVNIYEAPNAGPDLKVCPLGDKPAVLHARGPAKANYHWYDAGTTNPGQYLSCSDCRDALARPEPETYTYTLKYDGCPVTDDVTVTHDNSNYVEAPQDDLIVCRPDYVNLQSQAYGPQPLQNLPCGTSNNVTCTGGDSAIIGNLPFITPPKRKFNTPLLTAKTYHKYQFILKKNDILYNGIYSGTLNAMSFLNLSAVVKSKVAIENMTVSLSCVTIDTFARPITNSTFFQGSTLTQVASIPSYTITTGWNKIQFTTPYSWDTTKNLLVDICVGALAAFDTGGYDPVAMEEGSCIQKSDNLINVCGGNTPTVEEYFQRPVVKFNYCASPTLPFQYTWRPGDNLQDSTAQNPRAYIPRSITYAVYSIGRNGCLLRDYLNIKVPQHTLFVGPVDTFICQGQPAFLYASGGTAYKWYEVNEGVFSDATTLNCTDCERPTARPMKTTTYAVVYSNNIGEGNSNNPTFNVGCPDTLQITVNVWTLPDVNVLNRDTTITIGKSVELYVEGAQSFTWSPSIGLSDPNAPRTIATPRTTTTYTATGYDPHNCAYRDSVKITVNYHTNILIPSGFTPNGDGRNDIFRIVDPQVQTLLEFRVFNRWGQEVFSTTNMNNGWDGSWQNEPQDIGTYQYLIRVGYQDRTTETYKGDIQLIR